MKNKNIFKNIKDKIYNKKQCVCDSVYPYCSLCSAMCKERLQDRKRIKINIMSSQIDKYKKLIEDEFNKLVCNKTISNFKLNFDNDVDKNGNLTVDAQIRLKEPVRYFTIKESDFPGMTHEEFIKMCNEIKMEIEKDNQKI